MTINYYFLFQAGDKKKSRGMDNLRKSFRASLRRKKNKDGHHSSNSDKDFVRDRTGGKLKKISKKSKPERKNKLVKSNINSDQKD